ncbi:MAG: pyridoxal-phosphate dependent enzyme [Actinomycetota bacterium]
MKKLDILAAGLLVVGGLNWGLVAVADFDLVAKLEPASSAAIGGGERGPFLIQGWTGLVMPHWDSERVDHLEPIADDEAVEMTLRLSREEGIFAGISTGANVVGAHRLAERLGPDSVVVTLAVATGFKYVSVSPFAELG